MTVFRALISEFEILELMDLVRFSDKHEEFIPKEKTATKTDLRMHMTPPTCRVRLERIQVDNIRQGEFAGVMCIGRKTEVKSPAQSVAESAVECGFEPVAESAVECVAKSGANKSVNKSFSTATAAVNITQEAKFAAPAQTENVSNIIGNSAPIEKSGSMPFPDNGQKTQFNTNSQISFADRFNKTQKADRSPLKSVTPKLKKEILHRDQHCQHKEQKTGKICGSKFHLQVDHLHPLFAGGSNQAENLRILCAAHNRFRYSEGDSVKAKFKPEVSQAQS